MALRTKIICATKGGIMSIEEFNFVNVTSDARGTILCITIATQKMDLRTANLACVPMANGLAVILYSCFIVRLHYRD